MNLAAAKNCSVGKFFKTATGTHLAGLEQLYAKTTRAYFIL